MARSFNLEDFVVKASSEELVCWAIEANLLAKNPVCPICLIPLKMEFRKCQLEHLSYRCYNKQCPKRHKRYSITINSFFGSFGGSFRELLRALSRLAGKQPSYSILKTLDISSPTLRKLKKLLRTKMAEENILLPKLGGYGKIVNIDETMLNFKVKSHRGRSPTNRSDAICIAEVDVATKKVTRMWAEVIPNKESATLLPIIKSHVLEYSTIHTDEHKSYTCLNKHNFTHKTVCHKYNFVDPVTGIHTQAVESINNEIKYAIKCQKGVATSNRSSFLTEFIWIFNNKENLLDSYLRLIKIN